MNMQTSRVLSMLLPALLTIPACTEERPDEPRRGPGIARAYMDQISFWQPFQGLMEKHLSRTAKDGIELNAVDYKGVRADTRYGEMTERLEAFSPGDLGERAEKLAFWINTYNFLAIKLVADKYPVGSIRDIGSFFRTVWKMDAGKIGGREYSLDEIEHGILREKFREPRAHFAIVCASLSCPDIRKDVYLAPNLEEQLDEQTRTFLSNPTKGMRLDAASKKALLSKIFSWFAADFEESGGVWQFIRRYRPDLGPKKDYAIEYLPYNWDLNSI